MAHSTRAAKARKPHETTDALTARGDGRWCKRYKSNGEWKWSYTRGNEQEALDDWLKVKADLLAGQTPIDANGAVLVKDLCNKFLTIRPPSGMGRKCKGRAFITIRQVCNLPYKATSSSGQHLETSSRF